MLILYKEYVKAHTKPIIKCFFLFVTIKLDFLFKM